MMKIVGKSKGVHYQNSGSEGQRIVAYYIFNDTIQIMNTFEMNRFASLTYGDIVCSDIFEMLQAVISVPDEHTILVLQKSLCLIKHLVIYGSQRCVSVGISMCHLFDALKNYNTAIASQRINFFAQLKGGEVDKAFVVRQLAEELLSILKSEANANQLRSKSADPNSLVPVGNSTDVGFAPTPSTAREWMEEQRRQEKMRGPRSNLQQKTKTTGFGGGFHTQEGTKIISAAHSLEEMMQKAKEEEEKQRNRYFDDPARAGKWKDKVERESGLKGAEEAINKMKRDVAGGGDMDFLSEMGGPTSNATPASTATTAEIDLLGFDAPAPAPLPSGDLLELDLLGQHSSALPQPTSLPRNGSASLFDEDFLSIASVPAPAAAPTELIPTQQEPPRRSVMGGMSSAPDSKFSALDALDIPNVTVSPLQDAHSVPQTPPPKGPPPPPPPLEDHDGIHQPTYANPITTPPPTFAPPPPPPDDDDDDGIPPPSQIAYTTISNNNNNNGSSFGALPRVPSPPAMEDSKSVGSNMSAMSNSAAMQQFFAQQQQQMALMQQQLMGTGGDGGNEMMMQLMAQQQQQMNMMMQQMSMGSNVMGQQQQQQQPLPQQVPTPPPEDITHVTVIEQTENSNGSSHATSQSVVTVSGDVPDVAASSIHVLQNDKGDTLVQEETYYGSMMPMGGMGESDAMGMGMGAMGGTAEGVTMNPRFGL